MMERAVLLSDPTPEFMANSPQAFKVRLGEPMTFQDEWEVALAALSTPDIVPVWEKKDDEVLFQTLFTIQQNPTGVKSVVHSQYTVKKLQEQTPIRTGLQLFWALFFANENTVYTRLQFIGQTMSVGQKITLSFSPNAVVLQKKALYDVRRNNVTRMFFKVNVNLAVGMGWLSADHLRLGPNIYHQVPFNDGYYDSVAETELGQHDVWRVEGGFLELSLMFDWHFINVDEAFASYAGQPSKRLFVYCDLVESNRMGGQLHPLMREVHFSETGVRYFEPLHYQWMPLRRAWVDTVEVELADPDGTSPTFAAGQTVLTVLFRKTTV